MQEQKFKCLKVLHLSVQNLDPIRLSFHEKGIDRNLTSGLLIRNIPLKISHKIKESLRLFFPPKEIFEEIPFP